MIDSRTIKKGNLWLSGYRVPLGDMILAYCNTRAQGLIGLIGYSYQQVATSFSGSPSLENSKVKRAWPGAMGDRPGSSSQVRTSEDKVRRKDKCWSVRAVCILVKLPDISGPSLGEVGRYRMVSEPTLAVSRARVS